MPYSAKQLDQRYKDVCSNIEDAREYTLKNLKSVVSMNLDTFFKDLHKQDLKQCEKELETIKEVLHILESRSSGSRMISLTNHITTSKEVL